MGQIPFMFAIPFAARCVTLDWDRACATLASTLRSVLNQSDPDVYVGVACHDSPDLPADIRGRVNFIKADFPPPPERRMYLGDKRRKLEQLGQILSEMGGGYFFALDCDDLVSRDLVSYAREEGDANGYLIEYGYALNAKAGTLVPIPGTPGTWQDRLFHHVCGSCAILNLSCSELPGGRLFRQNKSLLARVKKHRQYGEEAAVLGRPLKRVPFPAAVCVLNTGNNVSYTIRCGREDPARQAEIHRDIDRNAVPLSPELAAQFGFRYPIDSRPNFMWADK